MQRLAIVISFLLITSLHTACGGARSTGPGGGLNAITVSSNAAISWDAPTEYDDRTPLPPSSIIGYQIYVGKTKDNIRLYNNIYDAGITSFKLGELGKGIRFIAVSCYDADGGQSRLSAVIAVNII